LEKAEAPVARLLKIALGPDDRDAPAAAKLLVDGTRWTDSA